MSLRPIVRRFASLLAVSALPLASAHAQGEFEGVITLRLNARVPSGASAAAMPAQQIDYLVRNRKVRVNMAGGMGGMALLLNPAEKKLYMLVPAQASYMEMPFNPAVAASTAAEEAQNVKITRTGRKETIAGYECEHVLVAAAGQPTTDICLSKALGKYVNPMGAVRSGSEPAWQRTLSNEGFPLRVTGADGVVALEVTRIDARRLDNEMFTVPMSYTRMQAPARR